MNTGQPVKTRMIKGVLSRQCYEDGCEAWLAINSSKIIRCKRHQREYRQRIYQNRKDETTIRGKSKKSNQGLYKIDAAQFEPNACPGLWSKTKAGRVPIEVQAAMRSGDVELFIKLYDAWIQDES
jgi:hypothetical protein